MQQAMNSNTGSTGNNLDRQPGQNWTGKTQSKIERGISDLKNIASSTDIKGVASDLSKRVTHMSGDIYRDSVNFVKRYPISSALGLAAVGFLAGMFSARSRR